MSLSRDALLFGIALLLYGNWMEAYGLMTDPFPVAGLTVAALGFSGSLASSVLSVGRTPALPTSSTDTPGSHSPAALSIQG